MSVKYLKNKLTLINMNSYVADMFREKDQPTINQSKNNNNKKGKKHTH